MTIKKVDNINDAINSEIPILIELWNDKRYNWKYFTFLFKTKDKYPNIWYNIYK